MKGKSSQNAGGGEGDGPAPPPVERRRWEAVLPREEIATLLAENRFEELLARLAEVRGRWPRDLELLRSVRVLEDHLRTHPGRKE